jgi:hypothetical protein
MTSSKNQNLSELKLLVHDAAEPMSFGCLSCFSRGLCGGLHNRAGLFSCRQMCCGTPESCRFVCPRRGAAYIRHIQEVGGLSLSNIPKINTVPPPDLPERASMLYGHARRTNRLFASAVSLPLAMLYGRRDGRLKFRTRAALAEAFLFDQSAQIVISGVDVDRSLERYWGMARSAGIVQELAALQPDLITVPNFSLFVDVVREDNLQNMKRIAICWYELAEAGIPTAIHLNGRTDADWCNWTAFLRDHAEIDVVAVEFATGLRRPDRGKWHVRQLQRLRDSVGRDLRLIVRGDRFNDVLSSSFSHVTFIDTSLYVKTMKRRKLVGRKGAPQKWEGVLTLFGQPLDDLLQHNVNASATVRS